MNAMNVFMFIAGCVQVCVLYELFSGHVAPDNMMVMSVYGWVLSILYLGAYIYEKTRSNT